jgi:glycine cleavage system aminomethyltransferase T
VTDGRETIGQVSGCVFSPSLKRNIGIGIISIEAAQRGTKVAVSAPDGERSATVAELPFVANRVR